MNGGAPLIGIDGFNLSLSEGTGVATYARNLAGTLRRAGAEVGVLYGHRIGGGDALSREVAFYDPNQPGDPAWLAPAKAAVRLISDYGGATGQALSLNGQVVATDFRDRLPTVDRTWNLSRLFPRSGDYFDLFRRTLRVRLPETPQVMHWTYPLPIRVEGAKNIYTLHDLVPLRLPHTTLDKKRRYLRLMRKLAAEADHIVTVSEASKRDIVEMLRLPEDRVTNTYQTSELPASALAGDDADVRREVEGLFGLNYRGYYLFFGAIEPKKNVARLLQAFLAAQVDAPLVLVGKKAWLADRELRLFELEALRQQQAGGKIPPRLLHVDYLPLPMLVSMVRGAKAVLFPSLYEGFGLPVLEAMQLGTPVITANTASLPEVAGEAALLVDPYRPRDLTAAILRVERDRGLRAELSAKGLKQAEKFSSAAYQARLAALYDRLGVRLQPNP